MRERQEPSTRGNARRHRRTLAWALAVSAALHVLAFLVWRGAPDAPDGGSAVAAERPPAGLQGALVAVSAIPRGEEAIPPPPRPVPAPVEPRVERREPPSAIALEAGPPAAPRSATLRMAASGPPGGGAGAGDGAGSRRLTPPVPRALFPEWDPPDDVKGTRVTVRVRVDATGRTTGQVELLPPTADEGFNRRLAEKALRMEYRPARLDGRPVAGWAEITFVF